MFELGGLEDRENVFPKAGSIHSKGKEFPRIHHVLIDPSEPPSYSLRHLELLRSMIVRLSLDERIYRDISDEDTRLRCFLALEKALPIVDWRQWGDPPLNCAVHLLVRHQPFVAKFFFDMVSRWLIPGQKIDVRLLFSEDFYLPDISETRYQLCEAVISVFSVKQMEAVQRNLSILLAEIRMGVISAFHAARIIEGKGLSIEEKIMLVQERVASQLQRWPQLYDLNIFQEMQTFFSIVESGFKRSHEHAFMARIICSFHLIRKSLIRAMETAIEERPVRVNTSYAVLHSPLGIKKVLGISVGIVLQRGGEVFEKHHLWKAIDQLSLECDVIEDTFIQENDSANRVHLFYIEVDVQEKRLNRLSIQQELISAVSRCVERLTKPIFMPRNEEEVMRNILTLSKQLKYVNDLPQVIISFDCQMGDVLSFTAVILRILKPDVASLDEIQQMPNDPSYIIERIKRVGVIRKKYPKEAVVMRLTIPWDGFLRSDQSVDLLKARLTIVHKIQQFVGEFRDYNGGMLAKQQESLRHFQQVLGENLKKFHYLVENFFHSIAPVEIRIIAPAASLKLLFEGMLKISLSGTLGMTKGETDQHLYIILSDEDKAFIFDTFSRLQALRLPFPTFLSTMISQNEVHTLGIILYEKDSKVEKRIFETLKK